MHGALSPDMITAYETANKWRPERRSEFLSNVVHTVFADSQSAGGFAAIHDFGDERLVHFDIFTGDIVPADDDIEPISPSTARSPISPSGAHRIELREHNLWLINLQNGQEIQLTTDGSDDYPYAQGRQAAPNSGMLSRPILIWSPDGRYAATQRLDLRNVRTTTVVESSPPDGGFPRPHTFYDPFPGDKHIPEADFLIIDTHTETIVQADLDPIPCTHTSPLMRQDVWWNSKSNTIYLVFSTRDWLELSLIAIEATTGETKTLAKETSDKRIRPTLEFHQPPCIAVNDTKGKPSEVIWFSERDGWGHLYLYNAQTGKRLHQITQGEFAVAAIHRVDWQQRTAWISVAGLVTEDPYRETICKVSIDTGELSRLTDDEQDHRILMIPTNVESHPWFFDAASTVSDPTRFVIRSWDGKVLADLGTVDIARLEATGWRMPERFRAKAADGSTDVFGTLFYPADFDSSKTYPVIDHVYPGPQMHRSVPWFQADDIEPYAALGMVGITIDGRGTPGRHREFYNASWRNVGDGSGLVDHVAAICELAETRRWMDAKNVAIHGRSAGGFATARAMELFPDFYKVGIAAAGRFEGRMVMAMIMEAYDDPYDTESWKRASAVEAADQITGKFLIVHAEMDVGCTIYHAYRLIDRMIEANRDFDLLVIPGDDHPFSKRGAYVERRIWDYLTTHVLGETPPRGFVLSAD